MGRVVVLGVGVALTTVMTACGGGTHRATTVPPASNSAVSAPTTSAPTTAATTSAASKPTSVDQLVTTARLKKALLTVEEMPTGFSLGTPTTDTSGDDPSDSACAKRYAALSKANASHPVPEADRDFDQGGLTGAYVSQQLTAFPNDNQAGDGFARFVSVLSQCPSFTSVDKAGARTEFTFAGLSFPKLGDQTFAAKLTAKRGGVGLSGHIVATRDGPLTQVILAFSLAGPDIAITEQVVRAGLAKLHRLR